MRKFSWNRKKVAVLVALSFLLVSAVAATILARKGSSKHRDSYAREAKKEEPGMVVLAAEKLAASGIEIMQIRREQTRAPLTATAAIEINADSSSRISSRVTGRIVHLMVSQGDRVKAGRPLASMDTVELDQIWSEYRKNSGRYQLALKNLKREEALFEKNVAPEKDVLKAKQDLSEAEADLTLSRERFRLLGVDVNAIEIQKNGEAAKRPLIPIISSVSGVVIEKPVTLGEVVNPEKLLFIVADLSTLWVMVDIYEKDVSRLRAGAVVTISVSAFPNRPFRGKISYIGDVVDVRTRTVKSRVTIDNHDGVLKPGMFATVSIDSEKDAPTEMVISVPEECILIDGSDRYVFVRVGEGRFKRKDVTPGRAFGKKVEISAGLDEGDMIVTKGTFPLKSEYKKQMVQGH
jgi:cobalt-zinc-cadmium efflux system membrane fusion protein